MNAIYDSKEKLDLLMRLVMKMSGEDLCDFTPRAVTMDYISRWQIPDSWKRHDTKAALCVNLKHRLTKDVVRLACYLDSMEVRFCEGSAKTPVLKNVKLSRYGYEFVNGELQIAEDEAEIIRLIYDKFIHTNMGISAIAAWLNQHGYKKKKRQNNTLDAFAASFIKGVLDNPVYCGKLAYGRRKNEKVSGTRNEYRIVKQENYMLHDGIHEGIISETDWELAHQKREKTGVKYEKTHSLDHEHILSGILRCPLCGSGMYGNVNRKKKKDGTLYKDYFYYACKHRRLVDGHKCGYRKQWSEEKINNAVEEVIRKLVKNPKFEEAILNKIGSRIDTEEIEKEIERLEKQHRQLTGAKARLGQQMDSLDIMDKFYEKKYQDMETRLYRLYDEIEGVENSIEEVKNRLLNIRQQKISEENVYQFLLYFDKLYDKFTDLEKKEFLNSFVEQVDIYEQEQPDGRFLKHIKFRFPVYFGDRETQELCWDNESTVETVVGLHRKDM